MTTFLHWFRELETIVKDLQEALVKRNPNSIAALIRANAMSDSVQVERKKQADEVS